MKRMAIFTSQPDVKWMLRMVREELLLARDILVGDDLRVFSPFVSYLTFIMLMKRGVAQPGSAPHWGCGGRRFKSCRPDHFLIFQAQAWM